MRLRLEVCIADRELCRLARPLLPFAEVVEKSIVDAGHSVVITTGNSFGQVSVGTEARLSVYLNAFARNEDVCDRLQRELSIWYAGELPVGDAIIVPFRILL